MYQNAESEHNIIKNSRLNKLKQSNFKHYLTFYTFSIGHITHLSLVQRKMSFTSQNYSLEISIYHECLHRSLFIIVRSGS